MATHFYLTTALKKTPNKLTMLGFANTIVVSVKPVPLAGAAGTFFEGVRNHAGKVQPG